MKLLYLVAGLLAGLSLVSLSVVCAVLYTPYTKSTFDTLFTAFTGSSLQIGNLLTVSTLTALVFEGLAAFAGVETSVLVPVLVAYAAVHVVAHRATERISDLLKQPLDPNFSLDSLAFGRASPEALRAAVGGGPSEGADWR